MTWIIALLVGVVALVVSASWSILVIKSVLSFSLVAFIPGFLILRNVLRHRAFDTQFVLLSSGLSVSITIVCGLFLHTVHALNPYGWIACLGSICLLALFVGIRREATERPPKIVTRLKPAHLAALSIAFMCVSSAIVLAKHGSSVQREFKYTELWMLPTDERLLDSVVVGLRNEEQQGVFYDLEVLLDEKTIKRWPRFFLKEHEERVERVPLSLDDDARLSQEKSLQGLTKRTQTDTACDEKAAVRKERPIASRGFAVDRKPCDSADEPVPVRYDGKMFNRSGSPCADISGAPCRDVQGQARSKSLLNPSPCNRMAVKVEQSPAMIRGNKQANPCDLDHKIEARLYKNGNLSFLYRSVWLSQIDKEMR